MERDPQKILILIENSHPVCIPSPRSMKMKSFHSRLVVAVILFLSSIVVVGTTLLPGGTSCPDDDDINAATTESPTNDDLVRDLLDWLIENGAYVNDKVEIRHMVIDDPLSPRGIFATDDMDVGATVCRIPWDLILKPNDEEEVGVGSEVTTSYNDPICATFDAVADAMSDGGKTPYGAYLLAQPKDYTPAFWSQVSGIRTLGLLMEMMMYREMIIPTSIIVAYIS
jgi:hypothetical protein